MVQYIKGSVEEPLLSSLILHVRDQQQPDLGIRGRTLGGCCLTC